jgi:hypothetical protein
MARPFIALPTEGFPGPGTHKGKKVYGIYTKTGEVYLSGETPDPHALPLSRWKQEYWDPIRSSLVIPMGNGAFVVGQDVLGGLPDTTYISMKTHFRFRP